MVRCMPLPVPLLYLPSVPIAAPVGQVLLEQSGLKSSDTACKWSHEPPYPSK